MKTTATLLLLTACSGTPSTTARLAPSPWCRDVIPTQNNGETSILHLGIDGHDWRIRVELKTANNGRTFGADYYASGNDPDPHMKARMELPSPADSASVVLEQSVEGIWMEADAREGLPEVCRE